MTRFNFHLNLFSLFVCLISYSQSESLTSSPYSYYGLGLHNPSQVGGWNAMGYSGLAYISSNDINSLNPAAFGGLDQNSFLFEVGLKSGYNTYTNKRNSDQKIDFNFSDIAIAFPITKKMGMGIILIPYSSVGYSLTGIETNIEGSYQTYQTDVKGYGGLNDFKINFGYLLFPNLRVGVGSSMLFGNITETENLSAISSSFYMEKKQFFQGLKLDFGLQLQATENLSFGGVLKLPTTLYGSMKRSINKTIEDVEIVIEDEVEMNTKNFELPLEYGAGLTIKFFDKKLTFNSDYYQKKWSKTQQIDKIGSYQDEAVYNIGIEFIPHKTSDKFYNQIQYRLGYSYDSGYLLINNTSVDSKVFTAGFGIPIGKYSQSKINVSYAYGNRGHIQNQMVKENFHLLTLNLDLQSNWFQKTKIR